MKKEKPGKKQISSKKLAEIDTVEQAVMVNEVTGQSFGREVPVAKMKEGEIGFAIERLHDLVGEFVNENFSNTNTFTLGWFITFEEGKFTAGKISDIRMRKLVLDVAAAPVTGLQAGSWMERLADNGGVLSLLPLENSEGEQASIHPLEIKQFAVNLGTPATPDSMRVSDPILTINNADQDTPVTKLRGYRKTIRVAFLDYATIWQMYMAYKWNQTGNDMNFVFTGAEITYGEMVSPAFQHERFRDWGSALAGDDPGICFTLKVEAIVSSPNSTNEFIGGDINRGMVARTQEISLPGVFILSSCKRYWQVSSAAYASCLAAVGQPKSEKDLAGCERLAQTIMSSKMEEIFKSKGGNKVAV